ncbi:hypothetical protein WA577_006203 [Blastocystis sp. JDR]
MEFNAWLCAVAILAIALFVYLVVNRKIVDVKGKRVLITGSASGIGRMLAGDMAKKGAIVVMWDINGSMLEDAANEIKGANPDCAVYTYVVDLSNRESIKEVAGRVKKEVGSIDILVNNAGIVTGKSIFNSSEAAIERIMDVNTNAHFWMIREFVPDMMERNSGSVVAISSMAGMVGTANLNDYCASKYAVVGLMESLEGELYNEGKRGVHCTVVCPYYIDTGMFAGVNPGLLPLLTPRYVVDKIMHAIEHAEHFVSCPGWLKRTVYLVRTILPYPCVLACFKMLGVLDSMNNFTGRQKKQE